MHQLRPSPIETFFTAQLLCHATLRRFYVIIFEANDAVMSKLMIHEIMESLLVSHLMCQKCQTPKWDLVDNYQTKKSATSKLCLTIGPTLVFIFLLQSVGSFDSLTLLFQENNE
jgi:hypothetical protein